MSDKPDNHDPYEAFREAPYRRYAAGAFAVLVGTRIQGVAIGWELYQRTGDALALGLVGLVQALPVIALAIPSGYLADHYPRRVIAIISLLMATLTSLGLAALSWSAGPVWLMYLILGLDATFLTLGRPARSAMLPVLVPTAAFPNAVAWNTSFFQIASVAGPALGGIVVALSVPAAYLISAAGSLIFVVMLRGIHIPPVARRPSGGRGTELLAGLRYMIRTPPLISIISLDMFAVLLGGAVYLLPIYASDILHVGPTGYGWLSAAPAIGALATSLFLAHRPPMRRSGPNLLLAVAGFGVATIVFGFSEIYWLSWLMLLLTGAFDSVSVVVRHTTVQLMTPDHMRGRVSAINSVFIGASNELGGMESGLVAHWFGPVFSVVSGGIGTLVVVLLTTLTSPTVRRLGALHEARHAWKEPPAPT